MRLVHFIKGNDDAIRQCENCLRSVAGEPKGLSVFLTGGVECRLEWDGKSVTSRMRPRLAQVENPDWARIREEDLPCVIL